MKVKTELTFPTKLKNQPILCDICKEFDISMAILEASFSTDIGWAIVSFSGSKPEIVKVIAFLKALGVEVKNTLNFL
jgi:L-aspartate semialdehyde sulfurtransferase ferredoxin